MPLKLLPDQSFEVWLDCDAHLPLAERPIFIGAVQSMKEQLEMDKLASELESQPDTIEQYYSDRLAVVARLVKGWKNLPEPYDKDGVGELLMEWLTVLECVELIHKLRDSQQMTEEEKKS